MTLQLFSFTPSNIVIHTCANSVPASSFTTSHHTKLSLETTSMKLTANLWGAVGIMFTDRVNVR